MAQQPADVEHAEEGPRYAGQRLADLRLAELGDQHDEERGGHQEIRLIVGPQMLDQTECHRSRDAEADQWVGTLVFDQSVELPLAHQDQRHDRSEEPQPPRADHVTHHRNQHGRRQETGGQIALGAAGLALRLRGRLGSDRLRGLVR